MAPSPSPIGEIKKLLSALFVHPGPISPSDAIPMATPSHVTLGHLQGLPSLCQGQTGSGNANDVHGDQSEVTIVFRRRVRGEPEEWVIIEEKKGDLSGQEWVDLGKRAWVGVSEKVEIVEVEAE